MADFVNRICAETSCDNGKLMSDRIAELRATLVPGNYFEPETLNLSLLHKFIDEQWGGYVDAVVSNLSCISCHFPNRVKIKSEDFDPNTMVALLGVLFDGMDTSGICLSFSSSSSPMIPGGESGGVIVGNGKGFDIFSAAELFDRLKVCESDKTSETANEKSEHRKRIFEGLNSKVFLHPVTSRLFRVDEEKANKVLTAIRDRISQKEIVDHDKDIEWFKDVEWFFDDYKLCPKEFDAILRKTSVVNGNLFLDLTEANEFAYISILQCFSNAGLGLIRSIMRDKEGSIVLGFYKNN